MVTSLIAPTAVLSRQFDVRLRISSEGDVNMAQGISSVDRTMVYRVVQEALTNIRQHSGSKTAAIRVVRESDAIVLEVEDSGRVPGID